MRKLGLSLHRGDSPTAFANTPSAFQQVFGTTNWRDSSSHRDSSPSHRDSQQRRQHRLALLLSGELVEGQDSGQGPADEAEVGDEQGLPGRL